MQCKDRRHRTAKRLPPMSVNHLNNTQQAVGVQPTHVFRPTTKAPIVCTHPKKTTTSGNVPATHIQAAHQLDTPNNLPQNVIETEATLLANLDLNTDESIPTENPGPIRIDFEVPCKDVETLFQANTFFDCSESDDECQQPRQTKILRFNAPIVVGADARKAKMLPVLPIDSLKISDCETSDETSVIVVGGITPNMGQPVYRFMPNNNRWGVLSALPETRQHVSMAVLQNMIYFGGGIDDHSRISSTFWSFDPIPRKWYAEKCLPEPRVHFGLVVAHQQIYAIGGLSSSGQAFASVRCYDPVLKMWHLIRPMTEPRIGAACVRHGNLIVVAGGKSQSDVVSRSVECYDLLAKRWKPLCDLRLPRCFAQLCSIGDSIYISGGRDGRNEAVWSLDVLDMSRLGDNWCMVDHMCGPRIHHAVAVIGTQILLIGGGEEDGGNDRKANHQIEAFCCDRKSWIDGFRRTPTLLGESVTGAVLHTVIN